MKIKSKIGYGLFLGSICLVVLMLATYVFLAITQIWWPAVVLTVVVISMCLVYFNTFYELLPEGIMLSCGFVAKAVPYRAIVSMTDAESNAPSFCLCSKRVLIRYMEDEKLKFTYASPSNREQFRELVNREIARVTESLKNTEKDSLDKAVKQAKKENFPLSRAEERAVKSSVVENERLKSEKDEISSTKKGEAKPEFNKKFDNMFDKSGKKISKESKKKEQEEKKLLAKLRKEKQKETKNAVKLEKQNRAKEQKILMEQTKRNEKIREEKLKNKAKEQKQKITESKLDKKQARFAAKETVRAEKIQARKQAKQKALEEAKQAEEKKQRKIAVKQVEKLKKSDQKATARKIKQDKKTKKDDLV